MPRFAPAPMRTDAAPHVRSLRSVRGTMHVLTLALLPCLAMAVYNTGFQARAAIGEQTGFVGCVTVGAVHVLPVLAVSLVTAGAWAVLFARLRRRRVGDDVVVTALLFTLVLPPSAPLWQVALGMSFGAVIGKEVFGGTGRNFVNPALAGLAFLYLAYPNVLAADPVWTGVAGYGGTSVFGAIAAGGMPALESAEITWWRSFVGLTQGALGVTSVLACLLGAVVLLATRVVSWRIMAAMVAGMFVTVQLFGLTGRVAGPMAGLPWYWHLTLGGFAFGTVFLATDPVTAAATRGGQWAYGLLIGGMVVVVRVANPFHPDGVMMAVLLGNIFAPLLDYGAMWRNMRWRARRGAAP